ncbi:DapH/DapD/GlmU-related protein [Pectobacterium polaris]|uniref:DapH/DapD/GlmU-related protein n=1 Tax=Pectobacterium polaris TaxID=2042057 RepID=UPI000BB34133|nr:DapH/DapD/GlmU-related protein [Pectobacterium polaris]ASY76565.1 lipopolysaccharide biosynthesis protein [Pectobacterium polaris]
MIYKIKWFISAIILLPFFKRIGFPSYIAFPLFFKGGKRISCGKRVRIFPGLRIETHNEGVVTIQDNVGIAQNVHITSAGSLIIGSGTIINANVFVTNIDHVYTDINLPVSDQGFKVSDTYIGSNCFIGIGAAIQAGSILGDHCIVGANAVVRGKFPAYSVIVGAPARIVKRYDHDKKRWVKEDH